MEPTAYNVTLVLGVMVNGFAGLLLLLQSFFEHDHPSYRRALVLTGLALWFFGAGFALHVCFHWRTEQPMLASALTLTYFHLGGMLFSWSHIGLVDPFYPSWRIIVRDLFIVACAIPCYWDLSASMLVHIIAYTVCALHCVLFAATFYSKYYRLRHGLAEVTADGSIRLRIRFMLISCHLIIGFGVGGILVAAFWQDHEWPFTLLMVASSLVFIYIAGSLSVYRDVVEQTGNAIEEVAMSKRDQNYARRIRRSMARH